MRPDQACRVVKVGGSLLDFSPTRQRLRDWLPRHSDRQNVLVAGGGKLVDHIRQWHRNGWVDVNQAHWMAIECMSLTARLLQRWLQIPLVGHPAAVAASSATNVVLDVHPWLARESTLPVGWSVTSDSIAAECSLQLGAAELLLLKSCPIPSASGSFDSLIEQGVLDRQFANYLNQIGPIGLVDFRQQSTVAVYPGRERSPVPQNQS